MISIMFIQVLPSVCHVKIDLMSFSVGTREAGGGDGGGCDHDWFTVIGSADGRPAPLLCGQLDGYSSKNFFQSAHLVTALSLVSLKRGNENSD